MLVLCSSWEGLMLPKSASFNISLLWKFHPNQLVWYTKFQWFTSTLSLVTNLSFIWFIGMQWTEIFGQIWVHLWDVHNLWINFCLVMKLILVLFKVTYLLLLIVSNDYKNSWSGLLPVEFRLIKIFFFCYYYYLCNKFLSLWSRLVVFHFHFLVCN